MRRWNRSRISIDCKQYLLSPKHDTSRRFLLVTFLKNRKEWTRRHVPKAEIRYLLAVKWELETALKERLRFVR